MPPEEMKPHQLFISADGGETYTPFGPAVDIPEMVVNPSEGPSDEEMLEFQFPEEMTMTVKVVISKNLMLWLACGSKAVPNNWLKMHGMPMMRKRNVQRRT